MKDKFGYDVTTSNSECIAAIDSFFEQVLAYGTNTSVISEALAADPGCALAWILRAAWELSKEDAEAVERARSDLAAAQQRAAGCTPRETLYFLAISSWMDGNIAKAIDIHFELAEKYPLDLFAAKRGQTHCLNVGARASLTPR